MLDSRLEFAYIRLCFDKPELWAIRFKPVDPMASWVLGSIHDYRAEFHHYPNLDTFLESIKSECKEQQLKIIKDSLDNNFDGDFVFKRVISFVKKQNLKQAILEATNLIDGGDISAAERALLKGTELIYTKTLDYFGDEREIVKREHYVSTGFPSVDTALGGGIHWENLLLIIGPKSSGKSLTMMNLGANAVLAGERVLYISFEDSEDQIGERFDNKFKGKAKPDGELFIHVFPSGEATVSDCEALVTAYTPRLVLVDYLNEMGWENPKLGKSEDLGERARGLKAIGKRKTCSVVTAQQAGRGNKFSEKDVTAEDAFWSLEPSQVADVVLTVNQTKDEKEAGRIRYLIDRQKNGPDGISFKFMIDYAKMTLKEAESRERSKTNTRRPIRRKSVL
jgi:hypothetical protein